MSRQFPVKGLAELDRYLSALPKNMETAAVRAGLVAAANPPLEEARRLASGWSGQVSRAIRKGSARKNQDGTFSIRIYVDERKPGGYLGYFGEYGVEPHLIGRTGGGEGRVAVRKASEGAGGVEGRAMKIGDDFVSGIISHPGHAAHPFMRPALDTMADEAVEAFATKIRDYLAGKTGFVAPLDEAA